MALGFQTNSNAFLDDHRPYFTVNYWDTVYTAESEGIELSLFTLDDGVGFEAVTGQVPQAVTRANMEAALNNQALMTSVLGYTAGAYNTGVTPNVYKYWGAGALPGITKSKATVLKFRGDVKITDTVTLIFGGQGRIQVYKNGTEIARAELHEPNPSISVPSEMSQAEYFANGTSSVNSPAGYLMIEDHAFTAGDDLEIYYWHNGEDWGGLFCKLLDSPAGNFVFDRDTIRGLLRDAPIMSASFFGIESGGGNLSSLEIPYVEEVEIDYNRDSVSKAVITVALTTSDQPNGFAWNPITRTLDDNAGATVIKEDRRVEIRAGYASPSDLKDASGDIAAAELFTRLTGHIAKIQISQDFQTAQIHCHDFASKMLETYDENYPDRLSYIANGYIYRQGGHEPMFPIPAFDGWPLEVALSEYCYRSGIDSKYLGKSPNDPDPNFGRRDAYTSTAQVQRYLRKLFAARHLGDNDVLIRLEKNSAYGNVGIFKKDWLPDDAEYLYKPEITRRCYDQAVGLAEHYGYNLVFDPLGRLYLRAGNNPDEFFTAEDAVSGGYTSTQISASTTGTWGSTQKHAATIGGTYMYQDTLDTFTVVIEGYLSRLDLYAGIGHDPATGNNGGVIDYDVEVWNGSSFVSAGISGSISTYLEGTDNLAFFYNGVLRTDGTNASVFELVNLPFDRYRITLSNGGLDPSDAGTGDYRINGVSVFYQDPNTNMYPAAFATDTNVFSLKPENTREDLRNHVIVVGSRKGVITDSAKLAGVETNPNNLDHEFNVAVAADPESIYNKNAVNFVGTKRIAVIYDSKVADSDFARWLALTALFRYRDPKYTVPVTTVALPMLEIGDAMEVYEAAQETVNGVVWVQSFRETWKSDEATVDITTASYPEIPSYQPRLAPDVDALYGGQPAANLRVQYTNLMGVQVDNTDLDNPAMIQGTAQRIAVNKDVNHRQALATTFMPETCWLEGDAQAAGLHDRALVNHPYRYFWRVHSWASNQPTVQYDFQEADGLDKVYGMDTWYDLDETLTDVNWYLNYKSFTARTGDNPFYDPYSSELGHFVNIQFNAIVSGRYRVSIWDARKSDGMETPVAWLTNPKSDPREPEDHWVYLEQQNDVEFNWDAVDNIGLWNRKQSRDYALRNGGAFGDETLAVGEGFYAWNDQTTDIQTQVGDNVAANYRTSSDPRESGFPYFTLGKYGQFYIKIEVLNDELVAIDINAGSTPGTPRIVRSDTDENGDGNLNPAADHTVTELYIWTHLGEPNQVDISIEEWNPDKNAANDPGEWVPGTIEDGWVTLGSSDAAIFRNGKPVKLSFTPRARAGTLFNDDPELTSVQLIRQAHLQATIFQQFWTFYPEPWQGILAGNAFFPRKELRNQMFHNNDHTKVWQDNAFRSGVEIANTPWVFQPSHFEMDFGQGYEESIRYGDYEQLEALPGYNARGAFDETLSYINLAFMNYLFYLSAYSLDRSGRRQWMLNRDFIDKTKIVTNTWRNATVPTNQYYAVDHELKGAAEYLRRSVFVREWRDSDWTVNNNGTPANTRTPLSPINNTHLGTGGISDADEQEWLQFPITYLDPLQATNLIMSAVTEHSDPWYLAYTTDSATVNDAAQVNRDMRKYIPQAGSNSLTAKTLPNTGSQYILPHAFGTWDFIRGPQTTNWYKPSPKRDFHPYWKPGMPNWHTPYTHWYTSGDLSGSNNLGDWPTNAKNNLRYLHVLACPSTNIVDSDTADTQYGSLRDPMAWDVYFGYAFEHDRTVVENRLRGARVEQSVAGWAKDSVQGDLQYAFDYAKEDLLARYESFRGVWSRGPYTDRGNGLWKWQVPSGSNELGRGGPRQRVKPSGVYYLNTARYTDFVVGMAQQETLGDIQHWTRGIHDWYYIRFQHEYVWYNDRHFPVSILGGSLYEFYRNEYTRVMDSWTPWQFSGIMNQASVLYDSGAWVGWKDDIAINDANPYVEDWTDAPVLRWGEAIERGGKVYIPATFGRRKDGSIGYDGDEEYWDFRLADSSRPWSSGGYQFYDTDASPGVGDDRSADATYVDYWQTLISTHWTVRNIFDAGAGEWGTFRLAVGPEVPTSREIYMNLVLPTRLAT